MDLQEVILNLNTYASSDTAVIDQNKTLLSLHQDRTVRDGLWAALDNRELSIRVFDRWVAWIGTAAIQIDDADERTRWMVEHGWGEMFFFSSWELFRHNAPFKLTLAACERALQYLPGDQATIWIMAMINAVKVGDKDWPTADSLPPLKTNSDGLIELPDNFAGAMFHIQVDERWTL